MGAICLTESDERVRPRAALKSASDERPKPPNTSLHFRMQCRKKCIAQCSSRWKGCSSALEFRCPDICAEVGFSPQCEPGTGRKGQSRQGPVLGRSFFPLVAMLGGSVLNREESKQRADFVTISHWLLIWSGR